MPEWRVLHLAILPCWALSTLSRKKSLWRDGAADGREVVTSGEQQRSLLGCLFAGAAGVQRVMGADVAAASLRPRRFTRRLSPDLAADLPAGEVPRAGVDRRHPVVGVHVDVRVAALH